MKNLGYWHRMRASLLILCALLQATPTDSFARHVSRLRNRSARNLIPPIKMGTSVTTSENGVQALFRVRTVTAFVNLCPSFFPLDSGPSLELSRHMARCAKVLQTVQLELENGGYEVQTVRIATNPFGEWLHDGGEDPSHVTKTASHRLEILASLLAEHDIQFCSLGSAETIEETITLCPQIIAASPRFMCSTNVTDIKSATAASQCILTISKLDAAPHLRAGMGNFRFCVAASCKPFIPFFPAAKSVRNNVDGLVGIALGLENGSLAQSLLKESKSIENIKTVFRNGVASVLLPLQSISEKVSKDLNCPFLGIDSSLNPSLDVGGSVAEAIETLEEVRGTFGGRGTLAAAAAITTSLQSLPGIKLTGYCGLMLPVCEDTRLSQLASVDDPVNRLRISDILGISNVCGVGVDTIPIPGDCAEAELASLILDVAGVAARWDKSLSCRVFPVPGLVEGERTDFNSPYLCNCRVFSL